MFFSKTSAKAGATPMTTSSLEKPGFALPTCLNQSSFFSVTGREIVDRSSLSAFGCELGVEEVDSSLKEIGVSIFWFSAKTSLMIFLSMFSSIV